MWNPPRDVFKKWVVLPLVTSGLVQSRCATIKKVQIMAETFRLQNCSKKCWVTLLLFKDVSNAGKMRAEAVSGGVQAALLDPKLVASPFHVLAAVSKAAVNREQEQMKTKNIFSEIIFCLSLSTNISDSFKKFGVKDSSKQMLIVLVHNTPQCEDQIQQLLGQVSGTLVPTSQLTEFHDESEIKKFFKITPNESKISSLENSVVTKLTIKDIT